MIHQETLKFKCFNKDYTSRIECTVICCCLSLMHKKRVKLRIRDALRFES